VGIIGSVVVGVDLFAFVVEWAHCGFACRGEQERDVGVSLSVAAFLCNWCGCVC